MSRSTEFTSGSPLTVYGRAIVETVRAPLVMLDEHLVVVLVNPAFCRTYELSAEDVVGRSLFEVGGAEWDVPELRSVVERTLPEEEEVRDLALRIPLGTLGMRDVLVNIRQVRLDDSSENLILLSLEDITERERFRRGQERYAAELERSNRDLQDFAHAASHDLQEPLRKIGVYVGHLASTLDVEALDERSRRYLKRLPEAASRLQRRIDDLLQLARLGRGSPSREETDLSAVVSSVLDDLEVPLRESDARVDVDGLPNVPAEPSQMRLLFQNLLSNALKFHKPDAPPIVRVRSEAEAPTGFVRVVVEDEGIGFEPEHADRIFGAFQRLHGRDEYEGSGVGLAICRRIVEQHFGSISAESRPGEGARFTILLPEHPPEEESEA